MHSDNTISLFWLQQRKTQKNRKKLILGEPFKFFMAEFKKIGENYIILEHSISWKYKFRGLLQFDWYGQPHAIQADTLHILTNTVNSERWFHPQGPRG